MDKILTTIVIATALATTGCSSFKTIDRTDVIPTDSQIKAQLAIEKKKEKEYEASKTGYPDTYIQQQNPTPKPAPKPQVTKPTTTVSTPIAMTPATPVAPKPVTTPTQVAQDPAATSPVTVSSAPKKPIREIIIYPDDTPPHDSATASKTPAVIVTPIASTTKPPVTTTPDTAGTVTIYKVFVGKFPTKEATEPLLAELKETYKEAFVRKNEGKEEYSVQIAASTNEKASNDLVAKLKEKGYKVFVLTVKK